MPEGTFGEQIAKGLAAIGLATLYSVYKELNPFMYRGYMYDGETGLYYNQSRYYSGEWGRFINADDPILMNKTTQTINGSNIFTYCENDPINYIDPTGYWAEQYYGFKWTSKGFNLYVNGAFLNKNFCLLYAADILWLKKTLIYKYMTQKRMAVELYFHAVTYYATKTLLKVGVTWSKIRSWNTSAKYMEINYNDKRVAVFYWVWELTRLYY